MTQNLIMRKKFAVNSIMVTTSDRRYKLNVIELVRHRCKYKAKIMTIFCRLWYYLIEIVRGAKGNKII